MISRIVNFKEICPKSAYFDHVARQAAASAVASSGGRALILLHPGFTENLSGTGFIFPANESPLGPEYRGYKNRLETALSVKTMPVFLFAWTEDKETVPRISAFSDSVVVVRVNTKRFWPDPVFDGTGHSRDISWDIFGKTLRQLGVESVTIAGERLCYIGADMHGCVSEAFRYLSGHVSAKIDTSLTFPNTRWEGRCSEKELTAGTVVNE